MKSLPLSVIAEKTGGKIIQGTGDLVVNDVVTRIRKIRQGYLLFDLYRDKDESFLTGLKNGTFGIITDVPENFSSLGKNVAVVKVANIDDAYWKFVEFYRSLFDIPVIGVTGTCGKTTTKEMIKHILSGKYRVNATYKSYNASFRNFGYLLDINDNTQMVVMEMGVAYPGDLLYTCRYFKPQVGVITNIGVDHLQAFGTLDAYIKAKAEFIEGLGYEGTLVLNADDENIKKIDLSKYKGDVVYFGFSDRSHFKASNLRHVGHGTEFTLEHESRRYNIYIPLYADFNVYNAIAAIAAAHAVGYDVQEAGDRLASYKNVEKHFEIKEGINGSTVIDDTWSTNPTSTEAALKLLKDFSNGRKTIAVLGKMSLLGKSSSEYHRKIGEKIADMGIDRLIVIGEGAGELGKGALRKGMKEDHVHFCKDSGEAYRVLKDSLDGNTVVLVKTSMLSSFDDLVDKIVIEKQLRYLCKTWRIRCQVLFYVPVYIA